MQVFIVKLPRYSPEIQGSIEENEDGQEEITCRERRQKVFSEICYKINDEGSVFHTKNEW